MKDGFSDVALAVSDNKRVICLKVSVNNPEVLRVYSAPIAEFSLPEATEFIGFDSDSNRWVLLGSDDEAFQVLQYLVGTTDVLVATDSPRNVRAVIAAHLKLHGRVKEYCAVTAGHKLPGEIQRLYARLGREGHMIIGAAMTFGQGKSAFRLAVRSYLYHRQLESSRKVDDDLVRQMLAWNIISQSYIALENLCAMFHALGASRTDPSKFAMEYLKFGRGEADIQGPNVTNVMNQILGRRGPDAISNALGIPTRAEDIAAVGLDNCGIESHKLIAVGRFTRDLLMSRLRDLARFVIQGRTPNGGAIKSVPAKAYGAFRHGFASAFPVHLPNGVILHGDPARFKDETDFLDYETRANYKAEIMYLGDPDSHGQRAVEKVRPIVYSAELTAFVRATYRAAWWTLEMAKYARSFFGSIDLRFPYLVNAKGILGQVEGRLLQARLDALQGTGENDG